MVEEIRNASAQFLNGISIIVEVLVLLLRVIWLSGVALFRQVVPEPKKSVKGKIVLVTGAGHGLGRLLALNFAELGARLVLWDINKEKCDSVAEEISNLGGQASSYRCDISDEKQVEETGELVRREVGDVRILINNAGVMPGKPMMYLNSYQIRRTLEINTLGHFWTIRQFLPNMLEVGDGHIIAVSSIAGLMGCANLTDYCASKYAVVGLMSALYEELQVQGKDDTIHLTVACPATMDTGMVQRPITRFPKLFPVLKVEKVAESITDAILRNHQIAIIPPIAGAVYKTCTIFPRSVHTALQRFVHYTIEPNIH